MKALPLLISLALLPAAQAQIFADVDTSMGGFTIQLNHTAAPRTVANFIGLAAGTRPWIHHATGAVHSAEPYYNGVTFHRVIAGFMSQTGSRKGDGTDGPGYVFRDELNNGLTHSGAHIVSMANSGPNSNGSQFFITAAAQPHLNGVHTVFGTISSGQAVVDAINAVPTTNSKPVTPVVIQSISIRRVGAAAQAFSEHAQDLPMVAGARPALQVMPGGPVSAHFNPPLAARDEVRLSRSLNLSNWSYLGSLYLAMDDAPEPVIDGIETNAPSRAFYHYSRISYPDDGGFSNHALASYQISYPGETRSYVFNAAGSGGTVTITPGGGSPTVVNFAVFDAGYSPYQVQLILDHGSGSSPRYLLHTLQADTFTANSCAGRIATDQWLGFWSSWKAGSYQATR